MLIPSIDLMGGRVVQLQQGEKLVLASDDLDGWIDKFSAFPIVQLIDLDAAMGRPANDALVRRVASALPCQVGGGVRSIERAQELLAGGARRVILGSSLFNDRGVNRGRAEAFAEVIDPDLLVGAIDSKGGKVVVHGWKTPIPVTPEDAARTLEPYVGAFLYTHVDTEGLLTGLNLSAVKSVQAATKRRLIAAGGIRNREEVDTLDRLGIDAVVGMAIYTGAMEIRP
ncbi:MAG: 1-(5-phosphoribosyl)-5-[(5-phosphoribosylamino)methylideneamino] imidazole-4-carboxamide isomerase [Acidobacteria bacterium]|nr:1-(5-phosphoribosyl)-5-[(5-phosphoribosylamino)methylideneamino] imidazole-4-carboxamide isomerase [Acidobacteriota bacterium]